MLIALVLYGMALSWNRVINVFKFQKVFLFFKSQVCCGFRLFDVFDSDMLWVLGAIFAVYMKTYTVVHDGFIGRRQNILHVIEIYVCRSAAMLCDSQ
jgi:hypothetical protein